MGMRFMVEGVECDTCGADLKKAYQRAGGEPDGDDWRMDGRTIVALQKMRCVFCDAGHAIVRAEEPMNQRSGT